MRTTPTIEIIEINNVAPRADAHTAPVDNYKTLSTTNDTNDTNKQTVRYEHHTRPSAPIVLFRHSRPTPTLPTTAMPSSTPFHSTSNRRCNQTFQTIHYSICTIDKH
jgi:hypothetical protein